MAQSPTTRKLSGKAAPKRESAEDKIAQALRQASVHAKKQLAAQGYKLPTQSWSGRAVRNPAV